MQGRDHIRQTKCKVMMSKEGSIKIVNFMTPGAGVLVLGHHHISHIVKMLKFFNKRPTGFNSHLSMRLYTDFLSEGLIFANQQDNHRIDKNKQLHYNPLIQCSVY